MFGMTQDILILIPPFRLYLFSRFSHLADGLRDREPCGVRPPPAAVEHDGDLGPARRGADVPRRVRGGEHRLPDRNGQSQAEQKSLGISSLLLRNSGIKKEYQVAG